MPVIMHLHDAIARARLFPLKRRPKHAIFGAKVAGFEEGVMAGERGMPELLEQLYAAVAEPQLWPQALDHLSTWLNCRTSQLLVWDRKSNSVLMSQTNPGAEDANAAYVAYYGRINPHVDLVDRLGPGKFVAMERHFGEAFVRKSEFYQDFYLRFGYRYLLSGTMHPSPERFSTFAFHRTPEQGAWRNADLSRAHAVMAHLQRVIQLVLRFEDLEHRNAAGEQALDAIACGVVALDARGHILIANREARRIIDHGGVFRATRTGLACLRPSDDLILQQAIRGACATGCGQAGGSGGALSLARPDGQRNFAVLVAPLPPRLPVFGIVRAVAIVFLTDPELKAEPTADWLLRLFGLTPTEAKVAVALAEGLSVEEISAVHATTRNTVRTQVQSILEKTQTKRQAQLVSLLSKLPKIAVR